MLGDTTPHPVSGGRRMDSLCPTRPQPYLCTAALLFCFFMGLGSALLLVFSYILLSAAIQAGLAVPSLLSGLSTCNMCRLVSQPERSLSFFYGQRPYMYMSKTRRMDRHDLTIQGEKNRTCGETCFYYIYICEQTCLLHACTAFLHLFLPFCILSYIVLHNMAGWQTHLLLFSINSMGLFCLCGCCISGDGKDLPSFPHAFLTCTACAVLSSHLSLFYSSIWLTYLLCVLTTFLSAIPSPPSGRSERDWAGTFGGWD